MTCHGDHPTLLTSRRKEGIPPLTSGINQVRSMLQIVIIMITARGEITTRSTIGNLVLRRLKNSNYKGRRRLTAVLTWFSMSKAMRSSDRLFCRAMII
jgi:hypothetical protein